MCAALQEKWHKLLLSHKARRAQLSLDVAELADNVHKASDATQLPQCDRYPHSMLT
jgi:hypothetical protein